MSRSGYITLGVILTVLVLCAIAVMYLVNRESGSSTQTEGPLEAPLSAQYTDLDGAEVSLTQYEGRVRVVNSWASWCPPCMAELKAFEKLASSYPEAEVVVIAINRNEPARTARKYLESIGQFNSILFILDPTDYFYTSINGFSVPETVIYDENGAVVMHKRGHMKLAEMKQYVEAALAN